MIKFIDVFNRKQVGVLAPRENTAIISISEPGAAALLRHGWNPILRLEFHDLCDSDKVLKNDTFFTEEMANTLWDFIHENKDRNFVVHCDAGISRSVAVGQIISELFPDTHELKLHAVRDTRFANPLVLRLMHKKFWNEKLNDLNEADILLI